MTKVSYTQIGFLLALVILAILGVVYYQKRKEGFQPSNWGPQLFKLSTPEDTVLYQNIPLVVPDENLTNIVFGQANQYILQNNGNNTLFRLEIFANLWVLDGNPFEKPFGDKQEYIVMLSSDDGKSLELGALQKDGDGLYKMLYKSEDTAQHIPLKNCTVVYRREGKDQVVLSGRFQ